jgi:hypothetical protein
MKKLDSVIECKTLSGAIISTTCREFIDELRDNYLALLKNLKDNRKNV